MAKLKLAKRHKSMAIGMACGLACAICVGLYITQVDEQAAAAQAQLLAEYGGEQIDVCVAKRDIPAGQTVSDGDVETRTWIATLLPTNAILDRNSVIGRQVGSSILAGEVISEGRFGFEAGEIDVPEGTVAVSVPTQEVQAVGGAIGSGMLCDVYAVGASSTSRLAESVPVLATSMSSDGSSATSNAWVTLAVSPELVQELVMSANNLDIYLTLPSSVPEATDAGAYEGEGAPDDQAGQEGEPSKASSEVE